MSEILFGQGLFRKELAALQKSYVVITDTTVEKLWASDLPQRLSFAAGEEHKTRETKQKIEDQMLARGLGRDCTVIALGGGVVLDLAGFVAATYCRGVPLISVPTTLLGMVDACLGGKCGVNTPFGKNLIGAFYPAQKIIIDLDFLSTLPDSEFQNGAAEIIKYGAIQSKELFTLMQQEFSRWQKRYLDFLLDIIRKSLAIKQSVIARDPQEKGLRRILNFGHTVGHAIERLENYQIAHGTAVAKGMAIEGAMSLKGQEHRDLISLLKLYGFDLSLPQSSSWQRLNEAMKSDKKSTQGTPRFVFLKKLGEVEVFEGSYCTTWKGEIPWQAT